MKKPYLSTYEKNFKNDVSIDGRTFTDSVEVTDCDINLNFDKEGTTNTRTIEDSDYDNNIFINE
ncbi:hypothetical protein [Aliarcobacter butzleri]|uniref:hypothetical protein n=1 Tax=Aliarcobacter butzleri TaxID=28197 RepID=UPI0021B43751|nr:hypothetical protein [Aliarcobacter butzleri]MCT7602388.1 hypothetical protein [Aliarcobacter butzleri]